MTKLYKLKAINRNPIFQAFLDSGILTWGDRSSSFPVVAGGAVRTFVDSEDTINDFDIFIIGDNGYVLKGLLIEHLDKTYENIFRCPQEMLYTYKTPFGKLQLVCPKIYNTIEELLDTFDLTPARAAFDGEHVYLSKSFIKAVKKKVLGIHKVSLPLATMNRIYKYKSYGYNIYEATEDFIREVHGGEFPEDDMFRHYID